MDAITNARFAPPLRVMQVLLPTTLVRPPVADDGDGEDPRPSAAMLELQAHLEVHDERIARHRDILDQLRSTARDIHERLRSQHDWLLDVLRAANHHETIE